MRARLAVVGYGVFYRLPHGARRRIIRLVTPKYIVGAVTMVRDTEAPEPGRLLLLRQPPGRGWTLPAGLLQRKEDPRQGAARELAEESGVDLEPEELAPAVPNAVVHAKGWVDVVFEASVPASTTELIVDGAEVYEAAWHPLDALPPLTTSTARLLAYYGIGPKADQPGPWTQARATAGTPSRQRSSQQSSRQRSSQQTGGRKPAAQ
jgi:ADP-ribose pyrophosphatase YjhB (NUDIX family)